jgi:hypothetical protein
MPASLDDVIRANRDVASLALTTEQELLKLHGTIPAQTPKGYLTNWAFIAMQLKRRSEAVTWLTGYNPMERSSWMTSRVVAIEGTSVLTHSGSVYVLKGESSTKVDLPYVCATFHRWGIGKALGVPEFFF